MKGRDFMNLQIGEQIKNGRIKRGWTQQELALSIGVTTQAVSKWETGSSYPDITLLPIIARSLNVSIDQLMDFNPDLPEKEVKKIVEKAVDNYVEKGFEIGYDYVKSILNLHPNSIALKFYLGSLFQGFMLDEKLLKKEKIQELYLESAKLYEEVLASGLKEFEYKTRIILVGSYMMLGEFDKAEKMIGALPDDSQDKEFLYGNLYTITGEKDKAREIHLKNLKHIGNKLIQIMQVLAMIDVEEDNIDKALEQIKKAVTISEILDFGKHSALQIYIKTLIEKGDYDTAVQEFEKLVELIDNIEKETAPEENATYIKSLLSKSVLLDKDLDKIREYEKVKLGEIKLRNYL